MEKQVFYYKKLSRDLKAKVRQASEEGWKDRFRNCKAARVVCITPLSHTPRVYRQAKKRSLIHQILQQGTHMALVGAGAGFVLLALYCHCVATCRGYCRRRHANTPTWYFLPAPATPPPDTPSLPYRPQLPIPHPHASTQATRPPAQLPASLERPPASPYHRKDSGKKDHRPRSIHESLNSMHDLPRVTSPELLTQDVMAAWCSEVSQEAIAAVERLFSMGKDILRARDHPCHMSPYIRRMHSPYAFRINRNFVSATRLDGVRSHAHRPGLMGP
ncbi:hypothetical protein GWK47_024789 [Chionoecetes opilio]|uniref:Uncharacterized protein n=1 Tax=Chionoecetes opilio TaxID=41210 RepID=A0A8J5CCA4_CHIOP|nr:hypothetical protein GWK47_024789 [Chionoecetes opilio]